LSSLFDICTSQPEALRAYLIRCSGSRQPLIEKIGLNGQGGPADYRCFGSTLIPRRRRRPAALLLRLLPALDARFSARAEQVRRATAERRWRIAAGQSDELRSDRFRLVEQYCFVAEALRVVEEQKQELHDEIRQIRANERERIAQDLHDHAGQELTMVLVALRRMRDGARGPARGRLDDIATHIAEFGRRIHHAVISGRPRIIEEVGLSRALETVVVSFAADGGLDCSFRRSGAEPGVLPISLESALYRVAQEALTNVLKHALGAQKVDVVLEFGARSVSLTITDDGGGFSPEQQRCGCGSPGIGLRGMHQRMSGIGGTLQISSSFGKGTTVTATAPLTPEPKRGASS